MPIYEYWCPDCRRAFEKLRSMGSKDSEVNCPNCGSPVKRMVSVVAAVSRSESGEYVSGGGGCGCGAERIGRSEHFAVRQGEPVRHIFAGPEARGNKRDALPGPHLRGCCRAIVRGRSIATAARRGCRSAATAATGAWRYHFEVAD